MKSNAPHTTATRPRRMVLGATAATGSTMVAAALLFGALALVFPWLAPVGADDASDGSGDVIVTPLRAITDGSETAAERVVKSVSSEDLPGFEDWELAPVDDSIAAPSLGFGCDANDGLAASVARTRTWTTEGAGVAISVRAYPAGGGALALDGITSAASDCLDATLDYPSVEVGFETVQIVARRTTVLAWRRGDVLVTLTTSAGSSGGSAPSPATYAEAAEATDSALEAALSTSCADPESVLDQATRSPYLDRGAFRGLYRLEPVSRSPSSRPGAAGRTDAAPVEVPAPGLSQPFAPPRPSAPDPLPTESATVLPAEVLPAVTPIAPIAPDLSGEAEREIKDVTGPGCGWAFTGQEPPRFDSRGADVAFRALRREERARLGRAWNTWQNQRASYWEDYATYERQAEDYLAYLDDLNDVIEVWAGIEQARSDYYTAQAEYEDAVTDLADFRADRIAARADYRLALAACAAQDPTAPDPTLVCPPDRPLILDETPPEVPPIPYPTPEAELPGF